MKTVIIGGGAAGTGAAGGAKAANPQNEVVVYTSFEDIDSFQRLFLAAKEDYVRAGIDIHYSTTVTGIDLNAKTIQVTGEGTVTWDRLVIATGFEYADPGVPGGD